MKNKKYIVIGITLLIIFSGFLYFTKESPFRRSAEKAEKIKVSLTVLDKQYKTEIKENSSVFDAMEQIKRESTENNPFSFKYIEHLGLGSFINEINSIAGRPSAYWIYYVNNKRAGIGVSKYILQEGDIINWKQESL